MKIGDKVRLSVSLEENNGKKPKWTAYVGEIIEIKKHLRTSPYSYNIYLGPRKAIGTYMVTIKDRSGKTQYRWNTELKVVGCDEDRR